MQKVAMPKVQGASLTMMPMLSTRNFLLAVMKVSLIQAMPKMETTAIIPAIKTLEWAISLALTLAENMMNAPKASMTNWTTVVMAIGFLSAISGSSSGQLAKRMIEPTPAKNSTTEILAEVVIFLSRVVTSTSRAFLKSGSCRRA